MAFELHKEIYADGADAGPDQKLFADWARKCQSEQIIRRVVSIASDFPQIRASMADIDSDDELVGIDGGRQVVDLRNGQVRRSKKPDLITRSLAIKDLGDAGKARRWDQFLAEIFPQDPALQDWVRRFLGYALTGLNREHLFVFAHGSGSNGKSVLLDLLREIWGSYARVIQPETLMAHARSGSAPSPDVIRLAGARLILGSETEEGRALAEGLIKQLTGGDMITARDMFSKSIEFRPKGKVLLAGNHKPRISGTDGGIWRRVRLIGFPRKFTPEERDSRLGQLLFAEASHIVASLLEGLRAYREGGLDDVPASMVNAQEEYRAEEDVVGQWITERATASGQATAAELYMDYSSWCRDGNVVAMSPKAFGIRLSERDGIKRLKDRRGVSYLGISLAGRLL
jgi:putative DNA primase/helicase